MKTQLATLETKYQLFMEKTNSTIQDLSCKVENLTGGIGNYNTETSELAMLKSEFKLFAEKAANDMLEIVAKVENLTVTINNQKEEILFLKEECEELRARNRSTSLSTVSQSIQVVNEAILMSQHKVTSGLNSAVGSASTDNIVQEQNISKDEELSACNINADISNKNIIVESTAIAGIEHSGNIADTTATEQVEHMKSTDHSTDSDSDDGFVGVKPKRARTKRFFVSGIAENVSKETIFNYLQKKGVKPTFLRLFASKRKGTLSAKLNVHVSCSKTLMETGFWPAFVRCRPWLSKEKFDAKLSKKKGDMALQIDQNDQND